jgi:hypothetical protein
MAEPGHKDKDGEHTPLVRLMAVLYFMGSSMLVQFTTKAVFTNYGFHYPLTVALLQMAFIAPVSYAVARPQLSWALVKQLGPLAMVNVLNVVCGLIGAQPARPVCFPCSADMCSGGWLAEQLRHSAAWCRPINPSQHAPFAHPPLRSGLHTHPSGTAGLNVPMFIALRRFTLLFTILLERFWLKKSHDWPTLSAMGIMIGGARSCCGTGMAQPLPGLAGLHHMSLLRCSTVSARGCRL